MRLHLVSSLLLAIPVTVLVAPPVWADAIQVSAIRLQQTAKGLEIILETRDGQLPQVFTSSFGKTFVANIPNTQLALPQGKNFRQENPIPGIAAISLTQQGANSLRAIITGTSGLPKVNVGRSDASGGLRQGSLVLNLTPPADTTAQKPTPTTDTTELSPPLPRGEAGGAPKPEETALEETDNVTQPVKTQQSAADGDEDIEIVVTGEQETRYSVPNATTGTRTDTPLRDIPQSIQVVPRQVLEDQQIIRIGDALQNVSGVNNVGSYSGYEEEIRIRGFEVDTFQGGYFRDGIRLFTFGFPESANLEGIEVLKGPASILFGQAQPGGIVNLVTKKPLKEPYYFLEGTVGNFDTYIGAFDLSGPLNDSGTLLYRLNAFYENAGSFRDFVEGERLFIAPVITWAIGPNTSLTIDAEFTDDSRTMDDGIPAIGDRPADIPLSRFVSEPFSEFKKQEYSVGYVFNHRFNDNLFIKNAFRAQWLYPERYYPLSDSLDEDTGELSRSAYWAGGEYANYSTQTDLIGKFTTGSIQHQLLFGFEYGKTTENPNFQIGIPYPFINIFDPVYVRQRYPIEPNFFRDDTTKTLGFYLQDQIDLTANLKFLVGGRLDSFDQTRTTRNLGEERQEFEQSDSKFSPRVGVVYQPSDTVSLYASYTSSFRPSSGTNRNPDDSTFEPETGRQYEVGIKTDFLDGKLSATLAAFDIKKQNVSTEDPSNEGFSIQTGEQTSRGIEFDVAGEILPGWNIIASAGYVNAYISEDETYEVGNRLDNAPEFSSSLWTTYEIQKGNLQGLGFGLGLYYVGDRQGDLDNSYELPSYFRTDAAIYYRRNNWRAALNIRNLFDIEYFAGSDGSRTQIQPGAPFTILGTFSLEF
ncbi:MAG TPA: TonB-dependent siderophore receptor [Leptolyngbyaceae cyanobacterium]